MFLYSDQLNAMDFLGLCGLHTPWLFGAAAALQFPEATAAAPVARRLTAAAIADIQDETRC